MNRARLEFSAQPAIGLATRLGLLDSATWDAFSRWYLSLSLAWTAKSMHRLETKDHKPGNEGGVPAGRKPAKARSIATLDRPAAPLQSLQPGRLA